MSKVTYVVSITEAGNVKDTVIHKSFAEKKDAVKYYNELVEEYINATAYDNDMSDEELEDYKNELLVTQDDHSMSTTDPDNEWSIDCWELKE